jgi:hypothetical protein
MTLFFLALVLAMAPVLIVGVLTAALKKPLKPVLPTDRDRTLTKI